MNRIIAFVSLAACSVVPGLVMAVTIPTVPVGNAGNSNDPATGGLYGGVAYDYRIGTYEVTVGQYTAFLNAVAATDTYRLYSTWMATDLNIAGIARYGSSGNYTYSVIGSPNKPVTYVSWGDAARFANWLHNGQPIGPQDASTTEDGAYELNGKVFDDGLMHVDRNPDATWFIPSESEWYKAAYYSPETDAYYERPFSSDTAPVSAMPGNTPNAGNFYADETGYAVTGSEYDSSHNYLSDVGAYTASASPYGAFDMGGNVNQWTEAKHSWNGFNRVLRGGTWDGLANRLESSYRPFNQPEHEDMVSGFRVAALASVPEPSTIALATFSLASLIVCASRRRRLPK